MAGGGNIQLSVDVDVDGDQDRERFGINSPRKGGGQDGAPSLGSAGENTLRDRYAINSPRNADRKKGTTEFPENGAEEAAAQYDDDDEDNPLRHMMTQVCRPDETKKKPKKEEPVEATAEALDPAVDDDDSGGSIWSCLFCCGGGGSPKPVAPQELEPKSAPKPASTAAVHPKPTTDFAQPAQPARALDDADARQTKPQNEAGQIKTETVEMVDGNEVVEAEEVEMPTVQAVKGKQEDGVSWEDKYVNSRSDTEEDPQGYLGPNKSGKRKSLVLDLDETLVHSSFKPVEGADFIVPVKIDGITHKVYVRVRPYCNEFLRETAKYWEMVIFTASLSKYADPLLDMLDKENTIQHRLFREHCVLHGGNYVKDLTKLGRKLKNQIIVDNAPKSYLFQPTNAIPITSWFDDPDDTELLDCIPALTTALIETDDVRDLLENNNRTFEDVCALAKQ